MSLCQITLSKFKVNNLKRHHETIHSGFSNDFPFHSQLRKAKLKKEKLHVQRRVKSIFTEEIDLTTTAAFVLDYNITKVKMPYTQGGIS